MYTTTNKKLKDPTACRLEHFWWHVWGSDRRDLSGEKLARLFEDISTGPTFVPLRSVANRWEGPDMPPITPALIQKANSADNRGSRNPQLSGGSHRQELANDNGLRSLSSSASKPPPAHPILKKSRGPSATGPRPTARFLSPHDSPDEDEKQPEITSSDNTTVNGLEMKHSTATVPSPAKKKGQSTKRFVASSANKRRPVMGPRRGSSQNSGPAEPSSRETVSSLESSRTPESIRAVSPIAEAHTAHGNSASSAYSDKPALSAKAAGKRPAIPRRLTAEKKVPSANGSVSPLLRAAVNDQAIKDLAMSQSQSLGELPEPASISSSPSKASTTSDSTQPPIAEPARPAAAPAMGRSQSHTGYERYRSSLSGASFTPGLFTGATASTTNVAAQGTIIDQSGVGSLPPVPTFYDRGDSNSALASRGSSTSLLEHRFTPTQPSPFTSAPLARTKSQLTLLLEREKERSAGAPSRR